MRLTWRDGVATLLVAAIVVPYVGYLINGSMPFIQDPTGMAGVGLVLGLAAALIGGWIATVEGRFMATGTVVLGGVSLILGVLALVSEHLFDPLGREIVLGLFMVTIVGLWVLALERHTAHLTPAR